MPDLQRFNQKFEAYLTAQVYEAGRTARIQGFPLESCPYLKGDLRGVWQQGWYDGIYDPEQDRFSIVRNEAPGLLPALIEPPVCDSVKFLNLLEVENEGYQARENGVSFLACPEKYEVGSDARQAWVTGWREADELICDLKRAQLYKPVPSDFTLPEGNKPGMSWVVLAAALLFALLASALLTGCDGNFGRPRLLDLHLKNAVPVPRIEPTETPEERARRTAQLSNYGESYVVHFSRRDAHAAPAQALRNDA